MTPAEIIEAYREGTSFVLFSSLTDNYLKAIRDGFLPAPPVVTLAARIIEEELLRRQMARDSAHMANLRRENAAESKEWKP